MVRVIPPDSVGCHPQNLREHRKFLIFTVKIDRNRAKFHLHPTNILLYTP